MPHPSKLTIDLLTLKVVSESRVTWAASVPVFTARRYMSIVHSGAQGLFHPWMRRPLIGPFSPYPGKARYYARRTLMEEVGEC